MNVEDKGKGHATTAWLGALQLASAWATSGKDGMTRTGKDAMRKLRAGHGRRDAFTNLIAGGQPMAEGGEGEDGFFGVVNTA